MLCVYYMFLVGGEAAGTRAHVLCVWPYFPFCTYVESPCVFMQEAEMGAASKEAAVGLSCAVNCVCVCVCVHLCVLLRACLRSLPCAEENRVVMLHLKGAVINEMDKRP